MIDEERLIQIETHLAELEHLVDRLNEVVREQGQQLRILSKSNQELARKLNALEWNQGPKPNEKPPHYQ